MRALRSEERELWRETMRGVKQMRRAKAKAAEDKPVKSSPKLKDEAKAKTHHAAPASAAPAPKPLAVPKPIGALDRRSAQRLKRGAIPIEARLDLHGMTQSEAHEALARFLGRAQKLGTRTVLVITGKSGVLHSAVPRWLDEGDNRARILAASRAHAQHGGSGALYLMLRRKK
jgi:DNA-nicking Smr family endonuclease